MRWRNRRAAIAAGFVLAVVALAGLAVTSSAGAAGVPVVVGGARPSMPSISGSQVVWADKYDGNWDLFRYDGITGTTSRLTADAADQSMPSVSGSRVAYVDYSTGNGDIVVRDLVTGVATRFALAGDQTNPTLSGDWLAWEDHSSRSGRVSVRNLATGVTYSLGSDGAAAEHPRIAGDLLVWEDHRANAGGRLDPDVWVLVLSTNTSMVVADADVTEYYPDTNGRYVVWSERASDGYHIRGYDVSTGSRLEISSGEGEQTTPAITDDMVYWTDNAAGQPLHVDTYDLASGRRAPFYSYSSGDVAGLAASGGNTAWLEIAGSRMRVRVLLGDGLSPLTRLATFNPVSSLVSSVRLALISTSGDDIAPAVASVSVEPGARRVSRTSSFSVNFSEPLDPATVSSRTLRLRDAATGDPVPATVRYSALTNAATLDPVDTLSSGAFTLEVDPMLTDVAGNALADPTELSFSTAAAGADVAKPTKPGLSDVTVSGAGNVTATWSASTDDVGISYYDVYRRSTPMSATDYAGRAWAATVPSTTLTATFAKASDETSKSYTYYYVVVARDTVDNTSTPSTNMAPNPHGTYSSTVSTNSCQRCHSVHGGGLSSPMLGARSAAACYECHGGTPATSVYGVASTMDTQGRFNDDSAIAPGGTGVSGGTGNGGWSIHRTDDMSGSTFGRECDACHSPHRKSYDDVPTLSYGRMLRIYSAQGAVGSAPAYSTDAATFGEKLCYECHGSGTSGVMDSFGGSGTYLATGGDHQAVYETTGAAGAAHSPDNVRSTTRSARPNGGSLPKIACLACHNEHASPVRALVDYRASDTTGTLYDQAGLCLTCHSEGSPETDATGTAPFAWNGRDVNAEFQATSHHPLDAGATGPPQPRNSSWTQTTQQHFQTDTLFQTVATAGNSVELEPVSTTGVTTQLFSDGFESNNFNAWTSSANWTISSTHRTGNYSARQNSTSADCTLEKNVDTSGKASATLAFWLRGNTNTTNTEYVRVMFKGQDGTWRQVWQKTLEDRLTTWTQYQIAIDPAVYGGFGANTAFRIVARVSNSTTHYQYVDDVVFSGATAGTTYFRSPGMVTSTLIVPPIGTLNSWGAFTVNGLEPSETGMTLDVLNGANDLAITGYSGLQYTSSPTVVDLTGLSTSLYPTLKIRARLQGNAADPRVVSDDFNDDTLDTAKWTDSRVNNALDPDNPGTLTAFSETWSNVSALPSGRWPTVTGSWAINANWPTTGQPSVRGGDGGTTPAYLRSVAFNVAGWSSVTVSFDWRSRELDPGEYMRLQYSTDGTNWVDGWSRQGTNDDASNGGTPQTFTISSPSDATYLRLVVEGADSGEYGYWDNITVRGSMAATDIWPDESGQMITLRASGGGFDAATSDQGEFLHLTPGASTAWIDTTDWEMVVSVESLQAVAPATLDAGAKAGLMVRASGADPLVNNAKYAGVFVSGDGSGSWQYRTTVGNNSTAVTIAGQAAPKLLKLKRAGNVISGWFSDDGATWTSAGAAQTITATNDKVYVGLAATSNSNTSFVDAVFDDFTLAEVLGLSATTTPRLDDWTLTYNYTPSPTGAGKVTCSSCHNAHSVKTGSRVAYWDLARVSDPHNTKAAPANYNAFCLGCHDGTAPVRTVSASNLVPYDVIFSTRTEPFFPGWDKAAAGVAWSSSGHANSGVTNMTPGCQSCHDPHGSVNKRLVALTAVYTGNGQHVNKNRDNTTSYEETLCLACHGSERSSPNCIGGACHPNLDSSGVGMNVQTVFSLTYKHPVSTISGKHSDLEGASAFGPSNRHSECVDCHDPHATKKGLHTVGSSAAGPAIIGAFGVVPTYSSTQWTVAQSFAARRMTGSTDYEAYLCFKCHSGSSGQPFSVTTASGTYISSDQALEFNPANDSGHNVLGALTNWPKETAGSFKSAAYSMTWPTNATFKTGWSKASKVTCSGCHTYSAGNAKGPHGSTVRMIIDSAYTGVWQSAELGDTNMICAKCHENIDNANDAHGESDHSGSDGRCIACHIKVPHGWKRPRMLGYTTDPEPYRSLNLTGITAKNYSGGNWSENDCGQTGCDEHSSRPSGTLWP
jgi:predicted CXXCH cytochrome family protein